MKTENQPTGDPLVLAWLGTPLISQAGAPLAVRTRKVTALLVYLTVEPGSHAREKLTALLWPESDNPHGRGMLRTTLAHLRSALDETLAPGAPPYLNVDAQTLSFNFNSHFDLDLHHIQAALAAVQRQPAPSARAPLLPHLQNAVNSYRADFLAGFSLADAPDFDDWAGLQREIWHSRLNLLYDTLSQWQHEAGDLPAALETATRWKAHDPFGERAPQRLMQIHFAGGNRAAALDVYAGYSRMVAAEFGGNVAPEIKALAARIRATAARPARPIQAEKAPSDAPTDLSFVGRVEEFARLMAAYQAASRGQTQVVCLLGEAGMGKTRLATEFLHWANAQGADLLSGRAFETGGELPYQPLAQLLRQRLEQESELTPLLSTTWLAELSRLLPEVRDRYPDLPQPQPDEATAQSRLLESIMRLGQALAERAPLLIYLDDIQWADTASLDALQYALARWAAQNCPILLLLCARPSTPSEKSNLRPWFARLKARQMVTQVELAPLSVEDTFALLSSLTTSLETGLETGPLSGPESGPAGDITVKSFAQTLFAETGGEPLYLVETLKSLLEQNGHNPLSSRQGQQEQKGQKKQNGQNGDTGKLALSRLMPTRIIPNSVREAIRERLARLAPPTAALLTAAAVIGQAATFQHLAGVAALEQMAALDALEELIAKRLLVEANQSAPERSDSYVIAHDTIREVIYQETSAARRQVLHGRAVTALRGSDPARLAYHALAAGQDAEALHYSLLAGDAALHLFVAAEAASHYETARRLVSAGQVPDVAVETLRHLYSSLGRALELNAQFEAAGALYEELQTLAQQRAAPALRLVALVAQVTLRSMISQAFDPVQGEALAQTALALARSLGDSVAETKILWARMNIHLVANRMSDAITCGDQALALARALGLKEQTAFILNDLGKCHFVAGRFDLAVQVYREANVLWRELNNLPMLADSLASSSGLARWAGHYDQALALSTESYTMSHSIANIWGEAYSLHATGYVHWERGQPQAAIATMEESIRLAEAANYMMPQIVVRADLGALYAALGDTQRGLDLLQHALHIAKTQTPIFGIYAGGLLARIYVRQNRLNEAKAILEPWQQSPQPLSMLSQWMILAAAELAFHQGNFDQALAQADSILEEIRQSGMHSATAAVLRLRAECLIALRQVEAAHTVLLQALAEAERLDSRWMQMLILHTLVGIEPDPIQAARRRHQCQELIAYITSHTPPELHNAFLDLAVM